MLSTTNSRLVALDAYAGFQARPHAWWPAFQSSIDFRSTFRTPFSGPPPRSALSTGFRVGQICSSVEYEVTARLVSVTLLFLQALHRNCQGMYVAKHGQQ